MNSPCIECIVRPTCKFYCELWFDWLPTKLPLEVDIDFKRFLRVVGNYGPVKNYYRNEYRHIKQIKFQKIPIGRNLRVCLTVEQENE